MHISLSLYHTNIIRSLTSGLSFAVLQKFSSSAFLILFMKTQHIYIMKSFHIVSLSVASRVKSIQYLSICHILYEPLNHMTKSQFLNTLVSFLMAMDKLLASTHNVSHPMNTFQLATTQTIQVMLFTIQWVNLAFYFLFAVTQFFYGNIFLEFGFHVVFVVSLPLLPISFAITFIAAVFTACRSIEFSSAYLATMYRHYLLQILNVNKKINFDTLQLNGLLNHLFIS